MDIKFKVILIASILLGPVNLSLVIYNEYLSEETFGDQYIQDQMSTNRFREIDGVTWSNNLNEIRGTTYHALVRMKLMNYSWKIVTIQMKNDYSSINDIVEVPIPLFDKSFGPVGLTFANGIYYTSQFGDSVKSRRLISFNINGVITRNETWNYPELAKFPGLTELRLMWIKVVGDELWTNDIGYGPVDNVSLRLFQRISIYDLDTLGLKRSFSPDTWFEHVSYDDVDKVLWVDHHNDEPMKVGLKTVDHSIVYYGYDPTTFDHIKTFQADSYHYSGKNILQQDGEYSYDDTYTQPHFHDGNLFFLKGRFYGYTHEDTIDTVEIVSLRQKPPPYLDYVWSGIASIALLAVLYLDGKQQDKITLIHPPEYTVNDYREKK